MTRSIFLAILLALSIVALTIAFWGKAEVNNPEAFSEGSRQALSSPEVRSLLTEKITEEIWSEANLEEEIPKLLPSDVKILSGTAELAARGAISAAINEILEQEFIESIWASSVKTTYNSALRSLQNKQSAFLLTKERVYLDISTTLQAAAGKLGLPSVIKDNIPSGLGKVELAQTQSVAEVKTAYNILNISPLLFLPAVVLLFAGLLLSERRALWRGGLLLGGSFLLAGLLLLFLEATLPPYFIGNISDPLASSLAQSIWNEWSAGLMVFIQTLFLLSLPIFTISLLAMPALRPFWQKLINDAEEESTKIGKKIEESHAKNSAPKQKEPVRQKRKNRNRRAVSTGAGSRKTTSQKTTSQKTKAPRKSTKKTPAKAAPEKTSSQKPASAKTNSSKTSSAKTSSRKTKAPRKSTKKTPAKTSPRKTSSRKNQPSSPKKKS